MNVVIDASVAAAWVIEEERSPFSAQLLIEVNLGEVTPITVPLFWYEVRNILVINDRRGRLGGGSPIQFVQWLRLLSIQVTPDPIDKAVLELAERHRLTAYDACYLALAISSRSALATNDRQLARAAQEWDLPLRTALSAEQLKS